MLCDACLKKTHRHIQEDSTSLYWRGTSQYLGAQQVSSLRSEDIGVEYKSREAARHYRNKASRLHDRSEDLVTLSAQADCKLTGRSRRLFINCP